MTVNVEQGMAVADDLTQTIREQFKNKELMVTYGEKGFRVWAKESQALVSDSIVDAVKEVLEREHRVAHPVRAVVPGAQLSVRLDFH